MKLRIEVVVHNPDKLGALSAFTLSLTEHEAVLPTSACSAVVAEQLMEQIVTATQAIMEQK